MAIVTISRGSYSRGKEVAEKVAQRLGFECISREVLIEASQDFNVPEIRLLRAISDAPSILDRLTFGTERYVAYIQAALLEHFQKDNAVYHGLAGHYFVTGVSHVLKVRILAELQDRIEVVLEREAAAERAASPAQDPSGSPAPRPAPMSREKALSVLQGIDEARRKWGLHLYGIDTNDPNLYDLLIHVKKLSTDDAAEIIALAARMDRFQATPESRQTIQDLALAARVKANLIERYPRIVVSAKAGAVRVNLEGGTTSDEKTIRESAGQISGVSEISIHVHPFMTPD